MGEQTHSQTLSSTPPVSASASASASAALPATTRASDPASAASTSRASAAASRASAAASRLKKKEANASPDPNPAKKHRLTFSIPGQPLSAAGEVGVAIRHLRAVDPALAAVIDAHEPPVFQCPHRPFHSLVRSILYQQLAFKAAASVYSRFLALLGGEASVAPDAVLALSPHQLRQIGVSPRKASYLHDLARKYASGILSDASIVNMDDRSLAAMLTMVKGIGAWSVHMFMIFSLARPDVLPSADLGVRKGVQMLYALQDVPRPSQMDRLCERWRPYRSVGAWYMWRLIESKVPQPAPPIPALPSPDGQIMLQQQQQQSVIQMIIPF
ncbi:uncharacterized protein LOC100194229 [Zea mays]|jgi:DNA-3-methyladenine glycosylase II|uniref:DNA glycosylase superfamily protein n=2 Tax=Zea mays TaxID=4577 RepID=B4FHY2_MAIZE|nr:uncharacterized protein LOC100194229 [Zea mays]ACF81725.1 unknown [Zea mays]AQK92401.1 DNA glycosylase superfamily protein [Zea mays]|eukprot:NP_001132742.1 uncharacterized protein LOC100194229 [Zea mays]